MPIYEFQCAKCGEVEELLVSMKEAESGRFKCQKCGGKMERIFSVTACTTAKSDGGFAPNPACDGAGG
ncbi:MAG: zinc ribbon domain-containing protein [bacterium]|jgi:putative FmdB family regulatory protein